MASVYLQYTCSEICSRMRVAVLQAVLGVVIDATMVQRTLLVTLTAVALTAAPLLFLIEANSTVRFLLL